MHATLCDFISDIVQNSIEAGSTVIRLAIDEDEDTIRFSVTDDGKGMDAVVLKKACDPFYTDGEKHSRRRVGLGIPFLIQAADAVGGSFTIESEPGRGTIVDASFVQIRFGLVSALTPSLIISAPSTGLSNEILWATMCVALFTSFKNISITSAIGKPFSFAISSVIP